MTTGFFVTGTDTEVGKTRISQGLLACLQQAGLRTVGMKPVASGCIWRDQQWQNEDALALMQQADIELPYQMVNPYAFEAAIAPHLAARQHNMDILVEVIEQQFKLISQQADAVVVEGAGGWLVPINAQQTMADIALKLQLPVILVVAIRLGCINHALLSAAAIRQSGLKLAGWIANQMRLQPENEELTDSLIQRLDAPCLGQVPPLPAGENPRPYLTLLNSI